MRCVQWNSHLFRAHKRVLCLVERRPVRRIATMPNRIQMCVGRIVDAMRRFERDAPDTDTALPLRPDRIRLNVAADRMVAHWNVTNWCQLKSSNFIATRHLLVNTMGSRDCPILIQQCRAAFMQIRGSTPLSQRNLPWPTSKRCFWTANDPWFWIHSFPTHCHHNQCGIY